MNVVFVGRDAAPSRAFALLADECQARGWQVASYIGDGKPIELGISGSFSELDGADLLVCGMSSTPELAREELQAVNCAIEHNIPFGFYADSYSAWARPWFAKQMKRARFLFVISDKEQAEAVKSFPELNVIVSGNPTWESYCFPKFTRQQVRGELGISDDQKMILVPGGKNLTVNILHFGGVLQAVRRFSPDKMVVVISLHPGDNNGIAAYDDLRKFSPVEVRIISGREKPTSDILPGADIVVSSMSSIGIEAAHQRIALVEYLTEIALGRHEQMNQTRRWDLCNLGAAKGVFGSDQELADVIAWKLVPGSEECAMQQRCQQAAFPASPKIGTAVAIMADCFKGVCQ